MVAAVVSSSQWRVYCGGNKEVKMAQAGVVHFWRLLGSRRARESSRPLTVGLGRRLFCAAEAVGLPGSGVLVLQRSEAQQG